MQGAITQAVVKSFKMAATSRRLGNRGYSNNRRHDVSNSVAAWGLERTNPFEVLMRVPPSIEWIRIKLIIAGGFPMSRLLTNEK